MSLTTGQALGHYTILGPLGAGGMGEVYRARDTRLEREVAIKVLPEGLADDENRLRRFEREAKTLASLNHSNVAGIHGVDHDAGIYFLALELVPGEDLAMRLARGPLPVDETIDVCRQIAEGLEAAHEAGVVHRDLKPANVRITPDGVVKILDFGLAKPARSASSEDSTLVQPDRFPISEEGLVLGTPTYMSPEQARGKPVDRRTDVWAFGCVLFECLTGHRAFRGRSMAEILAAILERDWDRRALPATTPVHVRDLLERCLDKDPRQRLRDIGEARIQLARGPVASAPSRRTPSAVGMVAGFMAAFAIGALAGRLLTGPADRPDVAVIRQSRLTERAGMEEMPSVSPDGKFMAFVGRVNGRRQVFVRLTERGSPFQVTEGDADHSFPRWADEGTLVYVVSTDGESSRATLWEHVILSATAPRRLGPVQGEADVSHSGQEFATFRMDDDGPALVLSSRDGLQSGEQQLGIKTWRLPSVADCAYESPRWSPDDRFIAYQSRLGLSTAEVFVLEVATGETRVIVQVGAIRGLAWLPDGSGLVYASSRGSTMAYPPTFSLSTVRIDGSDDRPLLAADAGYASFVEPDIGPTGVLVASRIQQESDVFRFPVDGTPLDNVRQAQRITRQTGLVQVPTVSPGGDEVAYLSNSGGHANVWVAPVEGAGEPRQITSEQDPLTTIAVPLWSPRGDLIAYFRQRVGQAAEQWLVKPDGSGARRLVVAGGGASWSPDGQWLYCMGPVDAGSTEVPTQRVNVDTGEIVRVREAAAGIMVSSDESTGYFIASPTQLGEVWKVSPVETGTPEKLIGNLESRIPMWPHRYALSPDDRWLATPLKERGTVNLWLISTEDGSLRQITDFDQRPTMICRQVSWSSDSKYLFAALMETDADIVLLEQALR